MAESEETELKPKRRAKLRRRDASIDTPDPVEIAMKESERDGRSSVQARKLLETHERLAAAQLLLAKDERVRNRFRAVRELTIGLAVIVLVGAAIAFVWTASTARGLVISAFSVPPDFEQRGMNGAAVASQLLDRLGSFGVATDSMRAPDTYANNWEGELSVEIPKTGVSIGSVERWLRLRLGNETRISGELWRPTEGVLALSVRSGGEGGSTFRTSDGGLDTLLQRAAEDIYRRTQPYRYAIYLQGQGRIAESRPVLRNLENAGDEREAVWATMGLMTANFSEGRIRQGLLDTWRAIAMDPDFALAYDNLGNYSIYTGQYETGRTALRRARSLYRSRSARDYDPTAVAASVQYLEGVLAELSGDYQGAARTFRTMTGLSNYSSYRQLSPFMAARSLALSHQPSAAQRVLRNSGNNDAARIVAAGAPDWLLFVPTLAIADEREDWERVVADSVAADGAARQDRFTAAVRTTSIWPHAAYAMARLGRMDEARALAARTPADCYPCLIVRGQVEGAAGSRGAADRWFALAVRQGPSLPHAHAAWAQVRLDRGDTAGAISEARAAQKKAPRWADPLKIWGDALARQGKPQEATKKYEEAAERAPRWGALHIEWARALWRLGRRDEARERFQAAAAMDLSLRDRAKLPQTWANISRTT